MRNYKPISNYLYKVGICKCNFCLWRKANNNISVMYKNFRKFEKIKVKFQQ